MLEISRNFDHRVKSFRKNLLMCKNSPLQIQYYHDRTEFQARGHPHIHGMAWSRIATLEKLYSGVHQAFNKLKERSKLDANDINALVKLAQTNI